MDGGAGADGDGWACWAGVDHGGTGIELGVACTGAEDAWAT